MSPSRSSIPERSASVRPSRPTTTELTADGSGCSTSGATAATARRCGPRSGLPDPNVDVALQPHPRQARALALVELRDDAAARRREPRRRSLAEHGDRHLRDDRDLERVREGPVERRGRHHRDLLGAPRQLVQVETEQALAECRRQRLAHVGGDLGRGALDGDPVDRERRGRARRRVEPERREQDQESRQEGAAGGDETERLEAIARRAAREGSNSACRARSRARAVP